MKKWWLWFIMSGIWILATIFDVLDNRSGIKIGFDIFVVILFSFLGIAQHICGKKGEKGKKIFNRISIGIIAAMVLLLIIIVVGTLAGNKGNVSDVNRIVGYSALYSENLINKACRVVENKFSEDFEGCTLTELRYDVEVENRFAEEIERYHKEKDQELIVLLSTFNTDEKGGK